MKLINKMLKKSSNKKEFREKAAYLTFIYNETREILYPFNNIYWCYNLNVDNSDYLSPAQITTNLNTLTSYIFEIIDAQKSLDVMFFNNPSISNHYVNEYNTIKKLSQNLLYDLATLVKNFTEMNSDYETKQNGIILKYVRANLETFENFVNGTEKAYNVSI